VRRHELAHGALADMDMEAGRMERIDRHIAHNQPKKREKQRQLEISQKHRKTYSAGAGSVIVSMMSVIFVFVFVMKIDAEMTERMIITRVFD
jgi:hypothetical protein